jgi:hypothetical protein
MPLVNPDMSDFAAASPGVTIDTCDDFTFLVLNGASQEPAVDVARGIGIELVNAIGQERFDLSAPRLIMEVNVAILQRSARGSCCACIVRLRPPAN